MYAEITLRCKRNLPNDLEATLHQSLLDAVDPETAMDATIYKDQHDFAGQIIYAYHTLDLAFMIFHPAARELKIHVEKPTQKGHLRSLKVQIDTVITRIDAYLKENDNRAASLSVLIVSDGDHVVRGSRHKWWQRVTASVKEDVLVKLYVPFATFIASLLFEVEIDKALFNALVAVIAMVIWVLLSALFIRKSFSYEDVP